MFRQRLIFASLFLLFSAMSTADPVRINAIAATLGKTSLTTQDAHVYRALIRFLDGNRPTIVIEEGPALKQTVQKLIFEEMVFAESQGFEFEGGSEAQTKQALAEAKARPGAQAEWASILKRFGVTEAEAIAMIKKHFRADKFLQKKIETLTPIITDSEIMRFYKENAANYRDKKLAQVRGEIVAMLKKERTERGLQDWMRYLTDKYQATIHLD